MNYWLMKSEPDTFGIDHLAKAPKRTSGWDGVRNFQARNFLREMRVAVRHAQRGVVNEANMPPDRTPDKVE